ncbi:hypothetical protein V7S43_005047 [Phytophthora oleae]|uniref:DIRP domain-containing protein n=1 Tax=Phytophthora oleae TaxID=2107226 RepID=A0ABD3FXG7_9STRA
MTLSERVLGPRWSLKELRTFYILLKAYGQQWDKLVERLPLRSEAMVRALFEMHRGYLSLPEASVEGFCAIMMDHYETQQQHMARIVPDSSRDTDGDVVMDVKPEPEEIQEPQSRSRKKRRLEKLLATDQLATLQIKTEEGDKRAETKKRTGRKSEVPRKARADLSKGEEGDDTGLEKLQGARFDLPWYHWFYSYIDVDFFRHNEFIQCLSDIGLGKITAAARPIWSSVRASMGRPRRLSPLFFAQEKHKLESYRTEKRRRDPTQLTSESTWAYPSTTTPLRTGVAVIVWMDSEQRFRLGAVSAFCPPEDTCQVLFWSKAASVNAVTCKLDNVMVLDFPPWSWRNNANAPEPKLAATTLLRRQNDSRGSAVTHSTPKTTGMVGDRYRDEKIRVVLTVKGLLHRKEKIVAALSKLNERVAEQQAQLHEQNAMKSSLWTTPTAFSSAAVKDLAWTNSQEKTQLQKQHSWLIANLNATNAHLKAALLSLQTFSASNPLEAGGSVIGPDYLPDASTWTGDTRISPTETLPEDQMRWAIDFLAASQQKATSLVAESALQVVNDDTELASLNAPANDIRLGSVLPETMQLVSNCVTLMSVLHRHVAASPDVPPVVTQKLVERVLELLKPTHEANMDLYAELRAAAEAAQAQMSLLAETSEADYE